MLKRVGRILSFCLEVGGGGGLEEEGASVACGVCDKLDSKRKVVSIC